MLNTNILSNDDVQRFAGLFAIDEAFREELKKNPQVALKNRSLNVDERTIQQIINSFETSDEIDPGWTESPTDPW